MKKIDDNIKNYFSNEALSNESLERIISVGELAVECTDLNVASGQTRTYPGHGLLLAIVRNRLLDYRLSLTFISLVFITLLDVT